MSTGDEACRIREAWAGAVTLTDDDVAILERVLSRARNALAGLQVPDSFVGRLADLTAGAPPSQTDWEALHVADLALAWCCSEGVPGALARFREEMEPVLETSMARVRLPPADRDDVLQRLRAELLIRAPDRAPKILAYKGRGPLRAWLGVTATRAALKGLRGVKAHEDEKALLAQAAIGNNPELRLMKVEYEGAFQQAFREALASLGPRDRVVLQQNLLDKLSIDEVGQLHGVHRATAARWIQQAKQDLLKATRDLFVRYGRMKQDECDSVLRLVWSQLDVTLRGLAK